MSNLEKLNKIISTQKSTWQQEATWRNENEEWLSQSFDIAMLVLDTLREKKMTQKELAEKMKVSPQFINKIVKGQENLSLETISKLRSALGIKLIEVAGSEAMTEVVYDYQQAYEVSELFRKQVFEKAAEKGYVGLESVQVYAKEQVLEYKMQA
ncbi:MAG: helix-turn-helix transcriptional regulator [Cytophagales bacterium]|nr:helix-turn-helix transcriptional regulator [Cytophagales bacterium]